jgi:ABC-type dipeptide/oligopeptide/nickel transport system ATPase component
LPQILGSVQSAHAAPGCHFAPRCTFQTPECATAPALAAIAPARAVRCLHPRFKLDERQWPNDAS